MYYFKNRLRCPSSLKRGGYRKTTLLNLQIGLALHRNPSRAGALGTENLERRARDAGTALYEIILRGEKRKPPRAIQHNYFETFLKMGGNYRAFLGDSFQFAFLFTIVEKPLPC